MLTGEPVADSVKFRFYEFVSRFSVSELQWCGSAEGVFRLGQPCVGFHFVAKDVFGLKLKQLNIIHLRLSGGLPVCTRLDSLVSDLVDVPDGFAARCLHTDLVAFTFLP